MAVRRIQDSSTHTSSALLGITGTCCPSVIQLCLTLWDPMDCSAPGFPILYLPEFAQIPVHWFGEAIQPSHPLSSPSPHAFTLCQHPGLFQWVGSLHQVAKVLELQLQQQSFQWIFSTDSFKIGWFDRLSVKELSRVFSSITIWKHPFLGAQPSLWSSSHICTWLLERL